MNIFKKLYRKFFHRSNADKDAMDYAYQHGFRSGKNFHYNSGFPIDANLPWLISVGDNVTLATGVKLLAHDASTTHTGISTKIGIVQVGNNVFIGANTIVLCNTRIGDNVIVGAGSVVTHDIPSNSVYAGNPAKFVCTFEEYSQKHHEGHSTHPRFPQHKWNEWSYASQEDWDSMRNALHDTYGYY